MNLTHYGEYMNKNNPLISIVIPVYNTEDYLEKCLDSLINQTLKKIEIIVVNDGSTDGSLKILEDYSKRDKRIKLINKKNEGQSIARNVALENVNGDYIAFIDSDDYIDLDAYEKLYKFIKDNDNDMVICDTIRFNSKKRYRAKLHRKSIPKERVASTNIIERPRLLYDTGIWNKLIKKSFWEENKFLYAPDRLYEDLLLATELHCKSKSVGILPDVKYYWRIREGDSKSTTQNTKRVKNLKDRLFVAEKIAELLESKREYRVLILPHYKKVLGYDLPIFINNFDSANKEFEKEFITGVNKLLKEIPIEAFENLGLFSKLKYQAIIENNVKTLKKLVKSSKKYSNRKKMLKYPLMLKSIIIENIFFETIGLFRRKKF